MSPEVYNFGYRTPRFPADFIVLLQAEGHPPRFVDGHCVNISEEGLRATFQTALEVGSAVSLILTLPGSPTSLRIAARLINRDGKFHGFTFVFASQKERDGIQAFIESLRARQSRSQETNQ